MAQPQHEGLPDPFDRNDPRQVDAAARTLLRQFFTHNDSKSFELLVEVSLPILNGATEDVAREEGVAVGAQALLSPVFSELFVSMRPPVGLLDASFLSWAVARAR